ncbi:homoserine kinase [Micavibrio aeruginosavorus]|uniref:Homoserine kinase n=1 Tax=Micavibrio aeruginosavorus EPB TaxID=349215 RepID=M4VHN9_9BACT|nr:homoserine kinase [Micavibrio aeruginosavorus]AGH97551.1 Homoserine kinase [Micavibrio aeruginosavorus EPB]
MAVYTKIDIADARELLSHYELGDVTTLEGIEQGVENTNYHLHTTTGRYILTLFEKRVDPVNLPFFFAWTDYLATKGITCPHIVRDADGAMIRNVRGRPAAVISFLDGDPLPHGKINPVACGEVGALLGKMHKLGQKFDQTRDNSMGLPAWKDLAARTAGRADDVEKGLAHFISTEIFQLEKEWPSVDDLPRGTVHADLFPDNVFFKRGKLAGVIDFYFSCTDFFVYDLMLTANAWCFDSRQHLLASRWDAFIAGYESARKLTKAEKAYMQFFGRAAALRIALTRLNDFLFHPHDAIVTPKDPVEYLNILRWHQNHDIAEK